MSGFSGCVSGWIDIGGGLQVPTNDQFFEDRSGSWSLFVSKTQAYGSRQLGTYRGGMTYLMDRMVGNACSGQAYSGQACSG